MASNYTTKFRHKTKTNAMGEVTIACEAKTNEKANCIHATGISEATNCTINDGNELKFPIDQTKANWGISHFFKTKNRSSKNKNEHKKKKNVMCNFSNASLPFLKYI